MNKYYIFIRNMVTAFIVLIVIALQSNADIASASLINLATDLEPIRASHSFPALAAAVMVDGKLHAVGVCGVRKYGTSIKAEIDDSFHLGSCTKAMTASMICLLNTGRQIEMGYNPGGVFSGMERNHASGLPQSDRGSSFIPPCRNAQHDP